MNTTNGIIPIQIQYGFQGNTKNGELVFPAGAVIHVESGGQSPSRMGWIKGQYQNQTGYFPLAFVPPEILERLKNTTIRSQQQPPPQQAPLPPPPHVMLHQQHQPPQQQAVGVAQQAHQLPQQALLQQQHQQYLWQQQQLHQQQQLNTPRPQQVQPPPLMMASPPPQYQQQGPLIPPSPLHMWQQQQPEVVMNSRPATITPTPQIQHAQDVKENKPPPPPAAAASVAPPQQVGEVRGKKNRSSYVENQIVWYIKKQGKSQKSKARILKIHLDDELVPFYDICLLEEDGNGNKEKQTTDDHLQPIQQEEAHNDDHQHQGIATTTATDEMMDDGYVHVQSLSAAPPAAVITSSGHSNVVEESSKHNPFEDFLMPNPQTDRTKIPNNPFDAFDDLFVVNDSNKLTEQQQGNQEQTPNIQPSLLVPSPPPTTSDILSTSPTTTPPPPTTAGNSSQNEQDLLFLEGFEPILSPVPTTVTTSTTAIDGDSAVIVNSGSTSTSNTYSRNSGNPFDAFDPLFNGNSVNINNNNYITSRLSEDAMTMSSMSSASLSLLDDYVGEQQSDVTFDKQSYSCSDLLFDKYDDTEEEGDDDDDEDFGFEIMGSPPVRKSNSLYNPWLTTSTNDNLDSDEEANRHRSHSLVMLSEFKSPPLLHPSSGATSISDDERAKKDYSRKKKKKKKKIASTMKKLASNINKPKKKKSVNNKMQSQPQQQQEKQPKQDLPVGQDDRIENAVEQVTGELLRVEIVKTVMDKKELMVTSQEHIEGQQEDGVPAMPLASNSAENTVKPSNEGHCGDGSTGDGATKKIRSPSKQKKKKMSSATIQMPLLSANSPAQAMSNEEDEDTPAALGKEMLSSPVSTRRKKTKGTQPMGGDPIEGANTKPPRPIGLDQEKGRSLMVPTSRRKLKPAEQAKATSSSSFSTSQKQVHRQSATDSQKSDGVHGNTVINKDVVAAAVRGEKATVPSSPRRQTSKSKEWSKQSVVRRSLAQIDQAILDPVAAALSSKALNTKSSSSIEKLEVGLRSIVRRSLIQIDHVIVDPVAAAAKKITGREQPQPTQQPNETKLEKKDPNTNKMRKPSRPTRSKSVSSGLDSDNNTSGKPSLRRIGSLTLPNEKKRKLHRRAGSVPNMKAVASLPDAVVSSAATLSRKPSLQKVGTLITSPRVKRKPVPLG